MELERYSGAFKRPKLYIRMRDGATFDASLVVPTSFEIYPINQSILCLLRIA